MFFSKGDVPTALGFYEQNGAIGFANDRTEAKAALARDWLAGRKPESSEIILAHTNADVQDLNTLVRGARHGAAELGEDAPFAAERGQRHFAAGDRVVFLANDRKMRVKNGTLGTVEAARPGRLTVRLDNGSQREVDQEAYDAIDHGYAITIHKSQGATVDRAYVLASGGMDRNLTYVAMTRHKAAVRLYAGRDEFTNEAHLKLKLGRERRKESTLDYAERRGIDTPRDWLDDARARIAALGDRLSYAVDHARDRFGWLLWQQKWQERRKAAQQRPASQPAQNHSALERGTRAPGATDLANQRNEIAQKPAAAPAAQIAGRPPAMSKQQAARFTAQRGPEEALDAVKAAEFKAIQTRAERVLAKIEGRIKAHDLAAYDHHKTQPQEPQGWLKSKAFALGFGRAEFQRKKEEWERKKAQDEARSDTLRKREKTAANHRSDLSSKAGKQLANARVKRHHPELVRDGTAAGNARLEAQKAQYNKGRQEPEQQAEQQPAPQARKPRGHGGR